MDFSKKCGKIKLVHGINFSFSHNRLGDNPIDQMLAEYRPALVGLHDVEHPYGQNQYVDIHCIFPDFTRDSADAEAYNFGPTDEYVSKILNTGAQIIFRLGESTDSYSVKPYLKAPADVEKWADVCLHVVMHFNAKWADGYKWNIKYFEIWSGADSKNGFSGDFSDYMRLYAACARKIKQEFPRVKVGGYSSLGFFAMNRVTDNVELVGAYPLMKRFLARVTNTAESLPLDFFTWCIKCASAEELSLHSKYAKSLLKEYGLRSTKSVVSEFSFASDTASAAEYLCAMITAHKSDIDMMLYKHTGKNEKKKLADAVYSAIYALSDAVLISEDYRRELYALAAVSESVGAIALASLDYLGTVEMLVSGGNFSNFDITELSEKEDGTYAKAQLLGVQMKQGRIVFATKKNTVYIVTLKQK